MNSCTIVLVRTETPELVTIARDLFEEYAQTIGTDLEYQGFAAELADIAGAVCRPAGGVVHCIRG